MLQCSSCKEELSPDDFTRNQQGKSERRRCKDCVSGGITADAAPVKKLPPAKPPLRICAGNCGFLAHRDPPAHFKSGDASYCCRMCRLSKTPGLEHGGHCEREHITNAAVDVAIKKALGDSQLAYNFIDGELQTAYNLIELQKDEIEALKQPAARAPLFDLPGYFTTQIDYSGGRIVDDYKVGGWNHTQVEAMLNDCSGVLKDCLCPVNKRFEIVDFARVENPRLWERFRLYESHVAAQFSQLTPKKRDTSRTAIQSHEWLTKLSERNGLLSTLANTRYLLHGTTVDCVESIVQHGLCCKYASDASLYGQGIYFSNSSCKAWQYTDLNPARMGEVEEDVVGVMVLCRVACGRVEKLLKSVTDKTFAGPKFHSATVIPQKTKHHGEKVQIHDEVVVYSNEAVYPEFLIRFKEAPEKEGV